MPAWLQHQVNAGCAALQTLVYLAHITPMRTAKTAVQLQAACALVIGPGRASLQSLAAAVQTGEEGAARLLCDVWYAQFSTLLIMVAGLLCPDKRLQAAFASSTAKPSALLPWLAVLSQALPLMDSSGNPGGPGSIACCPICLHMGSCE